MFRGFLNHNLKLLKVVQFEARANFHCCPVASEIVLQKWSNVTYNNRLALLLSMCDTIWSTVCNFNLPILNAFLSLYVLVLMCAYFKGVHMWIISILLCYSQSVAQFEISIYVKCFSHSLCSIFWISAYWFSYF